MHSKIQEIVEKLNELKAMDKRYSLFGSEQHKYTFNKKLSLNEIKNIEYIHSIVLSEEYKEILTNLGNGGAGCGYGLEAISFHNVDQPYIGTEHVIEEVGEAFDIADLDKITGCIKLFDYGCGMEVDLIVKGNELGELIWFDCDSRFFKMKESIFDLYIKWLEESLSDYRRVQQKMCHSSIIQVIKEEWDNKNFNIRGMVYSIADINVPNYQTYTKEYEEELIVKINKWRDKSCK